MGNKNSKFHLPITFEIIHIFAKRIYNPNYYKIKNVLQKYINNYCFTYEDKCMIELYIKLNEYSNLQPYNNLNILHKLGVRLHNEKYIIDNLEKEYKRQITNKETSDLSNIRNKYSYVNFLNKRYDMLLQILEERCHYLVDKSKNITVI